MIYSIIWAPTANITYYQILEYLEQNWSINEMRNFIDRVEQVVQHISENPLHYPYSKENDTYKCVVVKQVSLFYRLKHQHIELLVFWDNRQDPAKLIV